MSHTLTDARRRAAYEAADRAFWAADTAEAFLAAGEQFLAAEDWEDAAKRYYECQVMAEKIRLELTYREAEEKMKSGKAPLMDEARYLFTTLGDYRDAAEKAAQCDEKAQSIWRRQENTHRLLYVLLAVLTAAVVALGGWQLYSGYAAAKERSGRIAENFAGKTFQYLYLSDDNFVEQYSEGTMVEGTTYYRTVEDRKLTFRRDGSVYYLTRSVKEVLAYPAEEEEPQSYHTEYDGSYATYSVAVTMKGETFLILGEGRYPIEVDENDVPTAIYGYYSEPLT